MANLWTGTVNSNGEYQDLSLLSGVTFSEDVTYTIQIQNMAYIREGNIGAGILITDSVPFQYTARNEILYIKPLGETCVVNIAN